MDDILETSHFKNTKHHKYTFPKSNRFPQIKSQYKNDYFDMNSVISKRSTSFGYGSKYDVFKERQRSPGPSVYSVNGRNSSNTISFGVGRDKVTVNSYIDMGKIKNPSVGCYENPQLKFKKKAPSSILTGRKPCDSFIQPNITPEAGKYNPDDTFYSRRKRSAQFGFGSSKRFQYKRQEAAGPGTYESIDKTKQTPSTFGHAQRKTYVVEQLEKSITPGPIYYRR